jgi:nucleoside-diphosphate-sugar epimerase
LTDFDVVCLVHRRPLVERPGLTSVRADLMQPRLGLSPREYRSLAGCVDAVIHCAAVTDFNQTDGSLEATNIGGTEAMVAFAEASDACLYHVSTAYLHAVADGERGRTAVRYAASKRTAEELVRASATPKVILRPSIVIGDSRTGQISSFQGLYLSMAAILRGLVPLIPFDPSWPLDFVPCDVVADSIAVSVRRELQEGEFWVTAGERALTLEEAVAECVRLGGEIGITVDLPRFVPPETFDRLIGPVFLAVLPPKIRDTAVRLLEFFSSYLARDSSLPSSLDELGRLGAGRMPDPLASLGVSLRYWAETTGRAPLRPETQVA